MMPNDRYRAFLSYSHHDEAFARWLHRELERWVVPRDLVGRETPRGRIPPHLRPIFRDRDDFAGGASLRQATVEAIGASEFMVVLCSPAAAGSAYVTEEVRLFKALGRADRVIPVIVAGEPNDADDECFPRSVKYTLAADGSIGAEPAEPLAADARDSGDGRTRAAAKVVAGLLGVAFDEIVRRAEQARKRRISMLAGGGLGAAAFATAFSAYALIESHRAQLAIERSVYALGSMVARADRLDGSSDLVAIRAEMLMAQCDLMQGLARDTHALEADKQAICVAEQARVLAGRDERHAAIKLLIDQSDSLRLALGLPDVPRRLDLAEAQLRLLGERYQLQSEQPAGGEVLREMENVALAIGREFPEQSSLREHHEAIVWERVRLLEAVSKWADSRQTLQHAADLRSLQAKSVDSEQAAAAALQQAVFLRRISWLDLQHLEAAAAALQNGQLAVAAFAAVPEEQRKTPTTAYQKALAHSVYADALRASKRPAEAKAEYAAALDALAMAAAAQPGLESSFMADVEKHREYVDQQLDGFPP
jgi:hypothetical protein